MAFDRQAVVRALLEAGADRHRTTNFGEDALRLARKPSCRALLLPPPAFNPQAAAPHEAADADEPLPPSWSSCI